MTNCEKCHKTTGSDVVLCLTGRFDANGVFAAAEVSGTLCGLCWEEIDKQMDPPLESIEVSGIEIRSAVIPEKLKLVMRSGR